MAIINHKSRSANSKMGQNWVRLSVVETEIPPSGKFLHQISTSSCCENWTLYLSVASWLLLCHHRKLASRHFLIVRYSFPFSKNFSLNNSEQFRLAVYCYCQIQWKKFFFKTKFSQAPPEKQLCLRLNYCIKACNTSIKSWKNMKFKNAQSQTHGRDKQSTFNLL